MPMYRRAREAFLINDNMVEPSRPEDGRTRVEIVRGPNIKPFPEGRASR